MCIRDSIFQVAFGSLFDPKPRLGIVDHAESEITSSVRQMEGIELTLLDDAGELKKQVEDNDLDAGLVLPAGFDEAVRAGRRPKLEFYIGGESLASNRIIISVTAIDLLRGIEGGAAPVEVETVLLGEAGLPIAIRLVPLLVFYALVMAGIWVPASSLVEEKEKGTLTAVSYTHLDVYKRQSPGCSRPGAAAGRFSAGISAGTTPHCRPGSGSALKRRTSTWR